MSKYLLNKVKGLNLPLGEYALFGSAPLFVRGLREAMRDVDIVVTKKLWEEMQSAPGWKMETANSGDPVLRCEELELFRDWAPGEWDIDELIKTADVIDGLPFVSLANVLQWKKMFGREKDLADVKEVEKYLLTQ
jgi:predicted nucleotidyltransferase